MLTDHERALIGRAREIDPVLRAGSGDLQRLAGWLLKDLADLAERLGSEDGWFLPAETTLPLRPRPYLP